MSIQQLETDYLIIGSGAVGMAFADVLLAETDANIIIIDKHHKPGGLGMMPIHLSHYISHHHSMASVRASYAAVPLII